MGDNEKLLLKPWTETPYSFGFELNGGVLFGIPTVITDNSFGGDANLRLYWSNRSNKSYFINAEYLYQDVQRKLLSDPSADGGSVDSNSHTFRLGFGKRNRSKSFATIHGHKWGSFVTESNPYLGVGKFTVPGFTSSIDNVGSESLPGGGSSFFDMGTTHGFGLELRPAEDSRFQLTLMPNLGIGYRYAGDGEDSRELNGMYINFGINLMLGYGDNAPNTSHEYTTTDHIFAVYQKLHGFGLRFMSDAVMNNDNDVLQDSGLLGGGSEENKRDMTEQLRMLSSISSFSSGIGGSGTTTAFMETGDIRWLYFGLEMATGVGSLALGKSVSTLGAGAGDLTRGFGLLLNTAWKVDTPQNRAAKGDDLGNYMAYAFTTRLLLNSAVFFTGVAVGQNDAGDVLKSAGNQANLSLANDPAPGTDCAPYVSYNWIPITGYFGKHSGSRGGFVIDVSWEDPSWLYTQSRILTHGLTPSNIGNRFTEDDPYSDSILPSAVETTFGAQYSMKYFRVGAGIDYVNLFGGEASSAFGASARLMLRIPITEQLALTAGAYGSAHKFFGIKGGEFEVAGFAGLELIKWK